MKSYHSRRVLQNTSELEPQAVPTIKIREGEPEWQAAYIEWLKGKSPTDSPEWTQGVYLVFEPTEYLESYVQQKAKKAPTWIKVGSIVVAIVFAIVLLLVHLVR